MADLLNKTIKDTIGWKNAILALAAVFFLLNSAIMLPVAAIALLFIALEDIAAYSRGEDSLVGRYLKGMPAFKKVFDDILATFDLIKTAIGAIFSGDFTKLDEMTKKWGLFGTVVDGIAKALGFVKDTLSLENVSGAFGGLGKDIKEQGFGGAMEKQFQLFGGELTGIKESIGSWLSGRSAPATAPVTINSNPTINITGVTDPDKAGQAAADYIEKDNQKTYNKLTSPKSEKH